MEFIKQNKKIVIAVAAVLVVAIVAIAWIASSNKDNSSGKGSFGSNADLSGYSTTLPEYTKTCEYETFSFSDGSKRFDFEGVAGSQRQYADASGVNVLLTSQTNCVTVCAFDYSVHEEAFAADWVNTYLESRKFTLSDGYIKNENGLEVVMSIGTMPGFTDNDTSCLIIARTENVSLLLVVTGTSNCTYTSEDIAQIREAAYCLFDSLTISEIPTM